MSETLVVAGGCFWGLQELIRDQPGVVSTEAGYAGGPGASPTYESHAGHAEAVRVTYDPAVTSARALLDYFFRIHDPTTRNRQGNDVGSSYRSTIFYADEAEKAAAAEIIRLVDASGLYDDPVVTTLEPLVNYTPAEDYHQDYLRKHPGGYTCHFVRSETPITG